MELSAHELRVFLDEKAQQYNHPDFVTFDPIQIPKRFRNKADIEIAAFLSAIIAWGNRKSIITSASKLMTIMGDQPHDYIINSSKSDWEVIDHFVHRTFNTIDLRYCLQALQHLYRNHGGLHESLLPKTDKNLWIQPFVVFEVAFLNSTIQNAQVNTSLTPPWAQRQKGFICFCVGWCEKDKNGVDFGMWTDIPTSKLSCPLDVHTGNIARKLGLLKRKQNDQKSTAGTRSTIANPRLH